MPAYPTHTLFSHLCLQALSEEKHPWAGVAQHNAALFRVAGIAGADIQCMPYQICENCQTPYRHDRVPKSACLICGAATLNEFSFRTRTGQQITRRYIEEHLYGNTHLVLYRKFGGYGVPREKIHESSNPDQPFPDQVVEHLANCFRDSRRVKPSQFENYIAFILGWFSHVVSDAVFKGVYPHSVRVNFFGHQYNMEMLPAAETLTVTDIAHDFGVHWPSWHEELLTNHNDGGALKHLTMGNPPEKYSSSYWKSEFGRPDPAIGDIVEAVPPLNYRWFYRMYTQPDYSAPTPLLDRIPWHLRSEARFGTENLNLGQLRRYAKATGWYEAFIKGVAIYLRIVNEASKRAKISGSTVQTKRNSGIPSFSLWSSVVQEALAESLDWGSEIRVDPESFAWIRAAETKGAVVAGGAKNTDYQQQIIDLARANLKKSRSRVKSKRVVLIGSPQFNRKAEAFLCVEDSLRLKYDAGLAGIVSIFGNTLVIAGFSDFGDHKLVKWFEAAFR